MGLIDMARKSGSRLDYQFEKVNELYSYYIVTVKVSDTYTLREFQEVKSSSVPYSIASVGDPVAQKNDFSAVI